MAIATQLGYEFVQIDPSVVQVLPHAIIEITAIDEDGYTLTQNKHLDPSMLPSMTLRRIVYPRAEKWGSHMSGE